VNDHLTDPDTRCWEDLKRDLQFTPAEREQIRTGAQRLIAEARASRLSDVQRRQHTTQVDVARAIGVTQAEPPA
jgi:hypothetical protein